MQRKLLLVLPLLLGCGSNSSSSGTTSTSTGGDATSSSSSSSGGSGGASSTSSTSAGGASTASSTASTSGSGPACDPPALVGANPRGSDTPVYANPTYDYSPSVMLDGVYRMWWCCGSATGGVSGDHICYAEAASLDGPWHAHASMAPNTHDEVFHGTGNIADFDGTHTCDPSVVRVNGTYYMYYGGISEKTPQPTWTRIGVASSPDGFTWTRLDGGKAIVDAGRDPYAANLPSKYGTGQPSVTVVDGLFYMLRTDTSGVGSNPADGSGQYVLRSPDPTFQSNVEELQAGGFVPLGQAKFTGYAIAPNTLAGDWQYVDAIDAFAIAETYNDASAVHVEIYSKAMQPLADLPIPGHSTEEPALVSRPDKHAVPWGGDCGTVAFDVMRSVGAPGSPGTWDLAHVGLDLKTGASCACAPLGRMLEGTLLAVPNTPLTLARGGGRLQFELGPPATRLARTVIDPGLDVFNALPYAASVHTGGQALVAPGRPGAYLLDDGKLWPVSCPGELTDNGSMLAPIDVATYDAYPQGQPLFCLE